MSECPETDEDTTDCTEGADAGAAAGCAVGAEDAGAAADCARVAGCEELHAEKQKSGTSSMHRGTPYFENKLRALEIMGFRVCLSLLWGLSPGYYFLMCFANGEPIRWSC